MSLEQTKDKLRKIASKYGITEIGTYKEIPIFDNRYNVPSQELRRMQESEKTKLKLENMIKIFSIKRDLSQENVRYWTPRSYNILFKEDKRLEDLLKGDDVKEIISGLVDHEQFLFTECMRMEREQRKENMASPPLGVIVNENSIELITDANQICGKELPESVQKRNEQIEKERMNNELKYIMYLFGENIAIKTKESGKPTHISTKVEWE